jgi:peptidoglycan/LPS O-acetylase OafA/YrhL
MACREDTLFNNPAGQHLEQPGTEFLKNRQHIMRVPLIDPVKALAAQIIVLHHMMFYSGLRGPLEEAFPSVVGFLADPARYAVQVFLVIGGFLSMQGLLRRVGPGADGKTRPTSPSELVNGLFNRYKRLVRPFALAVLLACVMLAWVQHIDPVIELTPATFHQLAAHLLLLHSLLDIPALSAGVWYVAIDFQLFAMGLLMLNAALFLGRGNVAKTRRWLFSMLGACTVASLMVFNRDADLDRWGIFFFGSYGLGMLAAFAVQQNRKAEVALIASVLIGAALALQYRERLWVTLLTVGFLLLAPRVKSLPAWLNGRAGQFFQQSSYPLFLVHYPLSIMLFAVVDQMFLTGTANNLSAATLCWLLFMAGAWGLMKAETWAFDTLPAQMGALWASHAERRSATAGALRVGVLDGKA